MPLQSRMRGPPGPRHSTLHQSCTRLKLSRAAGSAVSAPVVSRVMSGAPDRKKNSNKYRRNDIWGRVFVNIVSLKYIGMIYINVGEMCFIPINVHDRTVQWCSSAQMATPFACSSPFSTCIRVLSSFFTKDCILTPHFSLFLSMCLSLSFCGTHPVFLISGLSLRLGDVDVFFLQSKVLCS